MGKHTRALLAAVAVAAVALTTAAAPASARQIDGTETGDRLVGTAGEDLVYAYGGDDEVDGAGGGDRIYGGEGHDFIYSRDNTQGASLWGEYGDDRVVGWQHDRISGGPGDDHLYFWNQRRGGKALCGSGYDVLTVTRGTLPLTIRTKGCEVVRQQTGGTRVPRG